MRFVIWLVLLATVAVVAATTLGSNDGLVSFFWGGWRTDLSLNLFLLLLLVGCAALLALLQGAVALARLPRQAAAWRARRREQAVHQSLRDALLEYHSGRYGRARGAARRAADALRGSSDMAGDAGLLALCELTAAASLHRLQDRPRRDATLKAALQATRASGAAARTAEEAARLLGAEWALDDHDAARATEMLDALSPGAARRTQALRLRLQAARLSRQPLDALHTARLLANHQAFSPLVARSLLRSLAGEAIDAAHDVDQLRRLWQQLDVADRRDACVAARAAQRAARLDAHDEARAWLRPFWEQLGELTHDDREQVALALVDARRRIGPDWLPRLEQAAQGYAHDSAVLAAVGMAFAERRLWGKARRLLEQAAGSNGLAPRIRRACWRELAALAREEADEARAIACERHAAAID